MNSEGTREGKNTYHLAVIRLQLLPTTSPEDSGWENTGYWPQVAEVYIKGEISVSPDYCICSYTEKSLNFFT